MKMKNLKKLIGDNRTYVITAMMLILSLSGLFTVLRHGGFGTGIYWYTAFMLLIPFMVIVFYDLVKKIESDSEKGRKILKYAFLFGWLFGISLDMGYQFQNMGYTLPGLKGKGIIIIVGFCLSVLFLPVTYRLFRLAEIFPSERKIEVKKTKCIKVFFISFAVLLVCWLPVFLAFFPGVMSYDFNRQSQEALRGYIWFYEYQPLSHTFLIRQFLLMGVRAGDISVGVAAYSVFQSLILSAAISACMVFVYKRSGIYATVFWIAFFALLPFNPVLAISITKDIIFSAFFVLILLLILQMNESAKPLVCILFIVCGVINIFFRNNAPYGLMFLVPAFLLTEKKLKRKLLYVCLTIVMIICGMGGKVLIRTSMHAIRGSKMEMYSVPLMQMVRTAYYQGDNLTPEQESILRYYIGDIMWGEYNPSISDAFKSNANGDSWLGENKDMIKDYITIGKAYPNDYIDAFLALTMGYWFIDDKTHAEMLEVGDDTGLGLLFTFNASKSEVIPKGIEERSYMPGLLKVYKHIVNGNSYYNWPVVSFLFKPATYFWLLIYAVFIGVYKRNKKSIILLAYPVFYMLTMLLGPCVHFRYIYPFVLASPIFISFLFSDDRSRTE